MATVTVAVSRFAKLPKWAQDEIRELRRQAEEAKQVLRQFNDTQTPSPIRIEAHVCLEAKGGPVVLKQYLQTDRVVFQIGEEEIEFRIPGKEQPGGENCVEVHASWHQLVVIPHVTNSLRLEVRK